jgi:hypothetical protein
MRAGGDMAQADGLKPFDFNRNTKALISRLVLAFYALDAGKWEYAIEGIEDIQIARALIPDNPFILHMDLWVHSAAIHLASAHDGNGQALRREAEDVIAELKEFPAYAQSHEVMARYFEALNRDEEARKEWMMAAESIGTASVWSQYAAFLYGRKELEPLSLSGNSDFDTIMRAFVLAETPAGREKAISSLRDLSASATDVFGLSMSLAHLHFFGDGDYAMAEGKRRLESLQFATPWEKATIEFLAGKMSKEKLLKVADGHRQLLCQAHRLIGMKSVGEHKREAAERQFQLCVDTRMFFFDSFRWSRAFLRRMEDWQWPHWVEAGAESELTLP